MKKSTLCKLLCLALCLMMLASTLALLTAASDGGTDVAQTQAVTQSEAADGDLLYTLNFNFDNTFLNGSGDGITADMYTVSGDNGEKLTFSNKAKGGRFYGGNLVNYKLKGNVYTVSYYVENSDYTAIRAGVTLYDNGHRAGVTNAKSETQMNVLLDGSVYEKTNTVSRKTDTANNNRQYFKAVLDGVHGVAQFYALNATEKYELLVSLDMDCQNLSFNQDYLRIGLYVYDVIGADQQVSLGDVQIYKGNTLTQKTAWQTAYDAATDGDVLQSVNFNDILNKTNGWEPFIAHQKADGVTASSDGNALSFVNNTGGGQHISAALADKTAAQYGSFTYEFYVTSNDRIGMWFLGNAQSNRAGFSYFYSSSSSSNMFAIQDRWATLSHYESGEYGDREYFRGDAVLETMYGATPGCDQKPDTATDGSITCNVKVEFNAVDKKITTYILKNGSFKRTASIYYADTSFTPIFSLRTYDAGTAATVSNLVIKKGLAADVTRTEKGIDFDYLTAPNDYKDLYYTEGNYILTEKTFRALPQTIEAWINIDRNGYTHQNSIFQYNSQNPLYLYVISGVPVLSCGSSTWTFSDVKVRPDTWTHLAITWGAGDGGNQILCYVNGALAQTVESETALDTLESIGKVPAEIYLGGSKHQLNRLFFCGHLGDIALYGDVRTADEIVADMTAADTADSALTAYYKLFEATKEQDIPDASGNGYDIPYGKTWVSDEEMEALRATETKDYTWSIAVLPDTQYMVRNFSGYYPAMFDYILEKKDTENIQYVLNVGDLTDKSTDAEWQLIKQQHDRLNNVLPYAILQGNHDKANDLDATFAATDGYYYRFVTENGGVMTDGSVLNTYLKFTVGAVDYIVLNLQYNPTDTVLTWASQILEENPTRKAIIMTHSNLNSILGLSADGGTDVWEMAKQHANVALIISGHIPSDQIAHRMDVGDHGNLVHQLLIDTQSSDLYIDGLGCVAMLRFTEDGKDVAVDYYSTVYDCYYREQNYYTFSFDHDCADVSGDGDHECDVCGTKMSNAVCADTLNDGDHVCDECGKTFASSMLFTDSTVGTRSATTETVAAKTTLKPSNIPSLNTNGIYEISYWLADPHNGGVAFAIGYGSEARWGWMTVGGNLTQMKWYKNGTAQATITTPERDVIDGKQYFKVVLDCVSDTMSLYVLSDGEYVFVETRTRAVTKFDFRMHNVAALSVGQSISMGDLTVTELCADASGDHKCDECSSILTTAPHAGEFDCSDTCATCGTSITPVKSHESDHACDSTCNECGEEAVATSANHTYDNACDSACNECGDTRTVVDHVGLYDCSDKCRHCNTPITPKKSHESDHTCDATCKYCGEDVVATTAQHTYTNDCDTTCNECSDTRTVDPHAGGFDCSDTCATCGTPITPKKGHEGANTCTNICKHCNQAVVTPTTTHEGAVPCTSTTCKHCGAAVTPVAHEGASTCTNICKHCNQAVVTPTTAHEGAIPCLSTVCKHGCGTTVTPVPHKGEFDCSETCKLCHTPIEHKEHVGETPCTSTVCKYGCGTAVTPVAHTYGEWQKHNDTQHKKTCACGNTQYADHAWGDPVISKTPTVNTTGEKAFVCADCGAVKSETLEKLPSSTQSNNTDDNNSSNSSSEGTAEENGLDTVAIIAISVGSAAIVGMGGFATYYFAFRKRKKH